MEESEAIDIVSTLVPFSLVVFIIALGVVILTQQFRKKLFQQKLNQEALKIEHQRLLLQNSVRIEEEQRKRIAKNLHDELGAVLSITRMWVRQLEGQEVVDKSKLKEVRELIDGAMVSTRRISHELMPIQLANMGLEDALKSLLSKVEEASGLQSELTLIGDSGILDWEFKVGLYRIFSELINNTIKHAEATAIVLLVDLTPGKRLVNYSDNGKGLPTNYKDKGLGMQSLESRVSAMNGKMVIVNQEGFCVNILFE